MKCGTTSEKLAMACIGSHTADLLEYVAGGRRAPFSCTAARRPQCLAPRTLFLPRF